MAGPGSPSGSLRRGRAQGMCETWQDEYRGEPDTLPPAPRRPCGLVLTVSVLLPLPPSPCLSSSPLPGTSGLEVEVLPAPLEPQRPQGSTWPPKSRALSLVPHCWTSEEMNQLSSVTEQIHGHESWAPNFHASGGGHPESEHRGPSLGSRGPPSFQQSSPKM